MTDTLKEHLKRAAAKRWQGKTKAERAAHTKMMVTAREAKRAKSGVAEPDPPDPKELRKLEARGGVIG